MIYLRVDHYLYIYLYREMYIYTFPFLDAGLRWNNHCLTVFGHHIPFVKLKAVILKRQSQIYYGIMLYLNSEVHIRHMYNTITTV
jgi:hypothetical protein